MLILTRNPGQSIRIFEDIHCYVLRVSGSQVRLGFSAPSAVPILREELYLRMKEGRDGDATSKILSCPNPFRAALSVDL